MVVTTMVAMGAAALIAAGCAPVESSVVINELSADAGGKIELTGTTASAVELSGWTVRRALGGLGFTFASGVTLAPGAHLVLTRLTDLPFALDDADTVILEDQTGLVLDRIVFDKGQADLSFCRVPDAEGPFQMCSLSTFGEANQP